MKEARGYYATVDSGEKRICASQRVLGRIVLLFNPPHLDLHQSARGLFPTKIPETREPSENMWFPCCNTPPEADLDEKKKKQEGRKDGKKNVICMKARTRAMVKVGLEFSRARPDCFAESLGEGVYECVV
eukprot:299920-Amorphochlora_amoeboformis.AAC.2